MILYLARHGDAAHAEPSLPSTLTPKGIAEVNLVAQHLFKKRIKITELWNSPKDRAVQTANIYAQSFNIPVSSREVKTSFSPGGDAEIAYHEIMAAKTEALFIVSHLPLLEELASLLVPGSDHYPHAAFPTAAVCCFERKADWELLWCVNPASLTEK